MASKSSVRFFSAFEPSTNNGIRSVVSDAIPSSAQLISFADAPPASICFTISCKTSVPLIPSNSLAMAFASIEVKPITVAKSEKPPVPSAMNSPIFSLVSFPIPPNFSRDMPTVL